MVPWRLIHVSIGITLGVFLAGWVLFSSTFSSAIVYGLGLGWLNLFSLSWLGEMLRKSGKLKSSYLPLWIAKWLILGSFLLLALKANLSPLGLICGFLTSLIILVIFSLGSIRNVLYPRSSGIPH